MERMAANFYVQYAMYVFASCSVEGEGPPNKKPRTTNVVVEQAGQTDKLLIDQVTDVDSVFEEVVYLPYSRFPSPSLPFTLPYLHPPFPSHSLPFPLLFPSPPLSTLQSEEWPLNWFCEEMFRNLINPAWEVHICTTCT